MVESTGLFDAGGGDQVKLMFIKLSNCNPHNFTMDVLATGCSGQTILYSWEKLLFITAPLLQSSPSLTHHQCQWEGRRVFWDIWSTWMFHNEWCSAHFECLQRMNLLQSITMLMYWWWSSPSKAGRQGSEERVFCYPPTSALTRGGQCRPPWPGGSPWCRGPSPCHSHWREYESSEERGLQNSREVYRSVSEAYFEQKGCE